MPNKDNNQTGRLLALNKWESPALISAFSSVLPSTATNQDGIRIVLSQTQDKFVVILPKLSAENEMAGDSNAVDHSVRYCEADPLIQRSRDTVFLSKAADSAALFHLPTMHIVLVDDGVETSVEFQHPVYYVVTAKATTPNGRRTFLACDCRGNVHVFGVDGLQKKHRLEYENLLSLQIQTNVNCFAAAYGKTELHQCIAKCIVAASTTTSQLYSYALPWSKIEKHMKSV